MKEKMNLYDDSHWQEASEYGSGAEKKTLRDENGKKTILLRLPENFHMANHTHVTTEQHFILDGEYKSEGKVYHKGDYQVFSAHENHGPLESEKGALVLVVWDSYQPKN
ncbi:cupin domain-containing protein [Tangfeifania diversioriginum]|nr:cupin domain-containing protein [Tangfeifania diversioriginum]